MSVSQEDVLRYVEYVRAELATVPDPAERARLLRALKQAVERVVGDGRREAAYQMKIARMTVKQIAEVMHREPASVRRYIHEYCARNGLDVPLKTHEALIDYVTPPGPERGGEPRGGV